MPKDTFYNLDQEKRERIINAAMDEFSENSYEVSSINQIVKHSNIAKGSFYQYFENKEDVYKYIIEICGEIKNEYIKRVLNRAEYMNFYDKLHEVFRAMVTFSDDNPKVADIINRLYRIDDIEFRNEIEESSKINSLDLIEELVEEGQNNNEIKRSMDPKFLASFLYNASIFMIDHREGQGVLYDIDEMVNEVLKIVSSGIKPTPRNKGFMNLL
ncbi:MAG: TetR/AcrR family transcriptional regulator [Andreesenia angusta]|nr:TetR/AcrR family transcriptional regulator [Andreesenia angusta]